jgi:flagellar basal body-associated protein FliL
VKKIILIVIGVAVLAIAGAAYMTDMFGFNATEEKNTVDVRPFKYVPVPSVIVTFTKGSTVRYVQVVIQLQSRDEESITLLTDNVALIQSVMLLEIGEFDFAELQTSAGKLAMMELLEVKIREIFNGHEELELEKVVLTGFVVQ